MDYNSMDTDGPQDVTVISVQEAPDSNDQEPLEESNSVLDSASNVDLMKQKSFPPLEDLDTLAETHSTWEITDWKSIPEREHGPEFEVAGFKWRILLFPEGNRADHVSLYLEASPPDESSESVTATQVDSSTQELGDEIPDSQEETTEMEVDTVKNTSLDSDDDNDWAVCAQFGLVMWNPEHPEVYHHSCAHHRFNADETDWGFTRFYELRKLFVMQGTKEPLIENNKVNISTYVRVIKDDTGVLWHKFERYDSKKVTGYVGLKNQGATCYLNSLLQSLYFTKVFRQLVYQIPSAAEQDTVSTALQRLFYLLNTSVHPVGTLPLTKSFGWDTVDAFTQHDVQELNRVLMDKLENRMKSTSVEGALTGIFVGQMKSYIKCVNVDFESSRVEDYWDIQLNVKNMKNVEESFKDYISVEMLEGENQYQAGDGLGLQDAKKGVVFESFPPVLHLQLKRYDYDFIRDMMVKINDRYEFPLEMDLSPYLDQQSPRNDENWEYVLHGVLVHSGDLNAGHYYALIKPEKDGAWYKFDDDRVTRASMKEVLEENFGGEIHQTISSVQNPPARNFHRLNYKRHSSAYMLVYIRRSKLDEVLLPGKEGIPEEVSKRIAEEDREEILLRKQREEQQYYLTLKVMTNSLFQEYHGFDLGNWEDAEEPGCALSFSFRRTLPDSELYTFLSEKLNIPVDQFRIWTMTGRQNKTIRLDGILSPTSQRPVESWMSSTAGKNNRELRLWLEDIKDRNDLVVQHHLHAHLTDFFNGAEESVEAQEEKRRKICIFLKFFDPYQQQITGVSSWLVDPFEKIGKLATQILQNMRWPSDTQIRLLEEVKPGMIEELKLKSTFKDSEISDGDVICFEKILSPEELESIQGYQTAVDFYDFLQWRIHVTFGPKHNEEDPYYSNEEDEALVDVKSPTQKGQIFDIWLSRKDSYDKMANAVASRLGVDPMHLRFFTSVMHEYSNPIKYNPGATVQQLLAPPYVNRHSSVVLYEVLDMSLAELETKQQIVLTWLGNGLSQEHKVKILVPKTAELRDALSILQEKLNIPEESMKKIKAWSAYNGRMNRNLMLDYPVSSLTDASHIYVGIMSDEEYQLIQSGGSPDKKLVYVTHFQKDPSRTHGIPFSFVLKKGEPFVETKARLQKLMGVYDKIFEKIRFAILSEEGETIVRYIEAEDDEDYDIVEGDVYSMINEGEHLGLDHMDRSARRVYGHQSAIFIK